jgi:hypothetical protein
VIFHKTISNIVSSLCDKKIRNLVSFTTEFSELFTLPRRLRWAVHVARMGRGKVHEGFWRGNLREGENLEDSGVDRKIMLKLIFEKLDEGMDWIDLV